MASRMDWVLQVEVAEVAGVVVVVAALFVVVAALAVAVVADDISVAVVFVIAASAWVDDAEQQDLPFRVP